ncbi:MAG: hypothetical protein K2X50_07875 [Gammaproteobacteria bacterium]|nr:hypothetical protein [Gammaproteobacteria bacterium]
MKKRQSVKDAAAIAASELNEINELNRDQRRKASKDLQQKIAQVDPHLYGHIKQFVNQYAFAILEKGGTSALELIDYTLAIDDYIKKNKDKPSQAEARALVNQAIYLEARDMFESHDLIAQPPENGARLADTKACGDEVIEAFDIVHRNLQPFRDERDERQLKRDLAHIDQAIEKANMSNNEDAISEQQEKKKDLMPLLKKISKTKLEAEDFHKHLTNLGDSLHQHIQNHNRLPEQTISSSSEVNNTSSTTETHEPLTQAQIDVAAMPEDEAMVKAILGEELHLEELLKGLEVDAQADSAAEELKQILEDINKPPGEESERAPKKETPIEQLLDEPKLTEDEEAYIKESVRLGHLNNELDKGVNNFLRELYQPDEGNAPDFFTQFEKHFLSLGEKIDQANFGFTHQEVKETFDRLKAFTAEVKKINSTIMDPFAKAAAIADLIQATPTLYRDAANVVIYTSDLMAHFKEQSTAFTNPQTGMGHPLEHYTVKFSQLLTKYQLHLKNYEGLGHHLGAKEKASKLNERYSKIALDFNRETTVSTTRLIEDYRKLADLHVKDAAVKTKTVSSKEINDHFKIARDQLFLFISGKMPTENKANLVELMENVLWLYEAKLHGGTSLENKEIILKNIPLLLGFCQIADPKHVNERLMDTLRSTIIAMRDPQAKNPLDFKDDEKQRKDFIALTNKVMAVIDETSIRANKQGLQNIAASFEEIDFKAGLPNTEDKGKEAAHEVAATTPKAEIEFADLSAQFQELSELKEPVQAEPAKPEAPEAPSEPEISMIDVEKYVEENKAMQAEITAAKEAAPVVQVAPPMAPVEPEPSAVQKTASVAQKAPTKEIPPEIAEFKKNLGTEGSVMYHLRFGYRTAEANMKPAEYIEHLKVCEPELYKLSEARAQRQIQGKQTDTPQSNRAEYREAMRNFRSEGKFGPIIALVGTGLGAVSNDLKTFATRITNPGLYRQQRDEAQLRAQIMAVSSELVKRVSQPETIPGTWQLRVELTRPLHQSIQADLNKVGKPGTDMNALRQKYSGSTTEVLKELLEKSNDQQAAKRELQAKNKQLNTVLEREDLSPKSREIFEAKQKKIEANIQKIDGAHQQESKATNIVIIVQIDTQLKSVMQQLHQAGIEPITTKWPLSRIKEHEQRTPLATLSFSCKEQKIEDLAAKLAQIRHPVSTERIKGNPVFKDNYSQALEKVQASRDQGQSTNTSKITINK